MLQIEYILGIGKYLNTTPKQFLRRKTVDLSLKALSYILFMNNLSMVCCASQRHFSLRHHMTNKVREQCFLQ